MKSYLLSKHTYITLTIGSAFVYAYLNIPEGYSFIKTITLNHFLIFLAFISLSASLILSLREVISSRYPEATYALNIISIVIFSTAALSYGLYFIGAEKSKDYQSSIALLISSVLVGSGWWVQAVISKAAARKSHTLNTLMNQRNSELFYKKNSELSEKFGFHKTINENMARKILDPDFIDVKNKKIKTEYYDAARGVPYILNYYEFICAGIINNDFDRALMKDCLEMIIESTERRFFYYLKISRNLKGKKAFENFISIADEWNRSGSIILKHENNNQNGNIINYFDNDEAYLEDISSQ